MFRQQIILACPIVIGLTSFASGQFGVDLTYDSATGHVSFESDAGVVFMQIVSDAANLSDSPVDSVFFHTPYVLNFLADSAKTHDFGALLPAGLTRAEVIDDLCVEASSKGTENRFDSVGLNGVPWITTAVDCQPKRIPRPPVTDPRAVLYYDASNGNLRVDVSQAADSEGQAKLTTLEIVSKSEIFTGDPAQGLVSPFAVDSDSKIFHHLESGFDDIDFGNVTQTGLSNGEFVADLCVAGSWLGGGAVTTEYQYPGAGTVPLTCDKNQAPTNLAVNFDEEAGRLAVNVEVDADPNAAFGQPISTLEIRSPSGLFTGFIAGNLDGPDDYFDRHTVLKQDPEGFAAIDFGPIIKPGTTLEMLSQDLIFDLTTIDGSVLGNVRTVPEPTKHGNVMLLALLATRATLRRRIYAVR